jgi:hypothetical protein
MWAGDLVAGGLAGPWQGLTKRQVPVGDPRYNEFDWESRHECAVFRGRI